MRLLILIAVLMAAGSARAGSALLAGLAQGASVAGQVLTATEPPKPGLKPEDSRNGGDGIKMLRPTQYDWDRYFREKGYINNTNQPDRSVLTTESRSNK